MLFLNNDVLRTEDIVCKYKLLKQFLQRASTCSTTASRTAQNEAEHYLNVDSPQLSYVITAYQFQQQVLDSYTESECCNFIYDFYHTYYNTLYYELQQQTVV